MRVFDLIKPGTQIWDLATMEQIFNERDRALILSIPFSYRNVKDAWAQIGDKSGIYSGSGGLRIAPSAEV